MEDGVIFNDALHTSMHNDGMGSLEIQLTDIYNVALILRCIYGCNQLLNDAGITCKIHTKDITGKMLLNMILHSTTFKISGYFP